METKLIDFLVLFIKELMKFGSWLTTELPYIGYSPLGLFTFAGLTTVIVFLVARLVVGG